MTGGAIFADTKSFVRLYAAQLRHNEAVGEWHRDFADDKITSGGAMVLVSSTAEIVQGTEISDNVVKGGKLMYGGGIFADTGSVLKLDNAILRRNLCLSTEDLWTFAWGGAIYLNHSTMEILNNSEISDNVVEAFYANGGGISAEWSTVAVHDRAQVLRNTAITNTGQLGEARGGGISLKDSTAQVSNGTKILENSAKGAYARGGGLHVQNSTARIVDSALLHNSAVGLLQDSISIAEGGGWFAQGSKVDLSHTEVSANQAEAKQAAVGGGASADASQVTMEFCLAHGNKAVSDKVAEGGLLNLGFGASVSLRHSEATSNVADGKARAQGGALNLLSGSHHILLKSSTFISNIARSDDISAGGAINAEERVQLVAQNSMIKGNIASGVQALGGALSTTHSTLWGCILEENWAVSAAEEGVAFGGAIYLEFGSLRLRSCKLRRNSAVVAEFASRSSGGALYAHPGTVSALHRCELADNVAGGAGLYQRRFGTLRAQLVDARRTAALQVYMAGWLELHNCVVTMGHTDAMLEECAGTKVSIGGTVVCAEQPGELSLSIPYTTGRAAWVDPLTACTGLTAKFFDLKGKIVVTERGSCTCKQTAHYAKEARASGLIVINSSSTVQHIREDCTNTVIPAVVVSGMFEDLFKTHVGSIDITSQSKQVAHPAWWWLVVDTVAEGFAHLYLNHTTFENNISQNFGLCEFRIETPSLCDPCSSQFVIDNGQCDTLLCAGGGDYSDCGTRPVSVSSPSSVGKLLHVLSSKSKVEIRGCSISQLELTSAATLGVVKSTFDPPLGTKVPTLQAPNQCDRNKMCDPWAKCEAGDNGNGVQCTCERDDIPGQVDTRAVPDGKKCKLMWEVACGYNVTKWKEGNHTIAQCAIGGQFYDTGRRMCRGCTPGFFQRLGSRLRPDCVMPFNGQLVVNSTGRCNNALRLMSLLAHLSHFIEPSVCDHVCWM